jgi:hypothetical protein
MQMFRSGFLAVPLLIAGLSTGCMPTSDLSGAYKTALDGTASGVGTSIPWHGSADVTLTQTGRSLGGQVVVHHPTGGDMPLPIASGSVIDGKVAIFGHNQFPGGTIDAAFHGQLDGSQIRGSFEMSLHTLMGTETDKSNFLLTKAQP